MRFIKPIDWISNKTWSFLNKREKQYIILVHKKKYTDSEIQDMLLYDSHVWLWKLKNRVRVKLKSDLNRVNEAHI